ncbi:MAG: DUF4465 domain-containing protein [Bacteroides sp.]|nr:DUF4465 domain-containing protein [Bacteroides sp.]
MKKLILPFFLLTFLFSVTSCDKDDQLPDPDEEEKVEVIVSFEELLTEKESSFTTDKGEEIKEEDYSYYKTTFQDSDEFLTLDYYYYYSPGVASGFTYTNQTDLTTPGYNNLSAITGKGKFEATYLTSFIDITKPAAIRINNPETYEIKGLWVTNSVYAYLAIKDMNVGWGEVKEFGDGDWFKLTIHGYNSANSKIGSVEVYLADYREGKRILLKDWEWVDLTSIKSANYLMFELASTDNTEFNDEVWMNTPAQFCIDGITLIEK